MTQIEKTLHKLPGFKMQQTFRIVFCFKRSQKLVSWEYDDTLEKVRFTPLYF